MKKIIVWSYCILTAVLLLFCFYTYDHLRLDIHSQNVERPYQKRTVYEVTALEDDDAPLHLRQLFTFRIEQIQEDSNTLVFHTANQYVRVLVDGSCIYEVKPTDNPMRFGSVGGMWNIVHLSRNDAGRRIAIELTPVYDDGILSKLDVMMGSRYQITMDIFKADIPIIIICAGSTILGLSILFIILFMNAKGLQCSFSVMGGWFYLTIGVWKLLSTGIMETFATVFPAQTLCRYMHLMLLPCPFIFFTMDLAGHKGKFYGFPCVCSIINVIVCLSLHFTGIADFKETVYITHFALAIAVIWACIFVLKSIQSNGFKGQTRAMTVCVFSCLLWFALEITKYYNGEHLSLLMSYLGMFGFLLHILILLVNSIREIKEMMTIGMHAKQYQKIAFKDQLTGFLNRTSYNEYVESKQFMPNGYAVAVFDLNNLKKCNDTLGHDKGDVYIRESARVIRECFGDIGLCYRMGGDEFCVLINRAEEELLLKRMSEMHEKEQEYREELAGVQTGIAGGFAIFDPDQDQTIYDVNKRADKFMYQEKFSMKQQDIQN